ncbi:hypothetical protein CM19_10570 [Candidatus Acidianus copahuensis]|uniref:Uncharacterized protein n=1 Tax=Candidatus Acidianus copahuensis TaxID=1160895 RepID=A0A031LL63_9CREN|nr:hypothetical protein [Candidatus Acidianus copahuensis]EZQ02242.1 hypothetical protein CM19_10570 [Candidatus Acidianus copahuensis]
MGVFKKEKTYTGSFDLNSVVQKFSDYLQSDGWKIQNKTYGDKAIIQAQKAGILRDIFAADRALTFTFEKTANGLKVTTGVGKWIQNLAVTAVETILLSELFLVVDVPEMLWTSHVENNLLQKLDDIISNTTS